MVGVVGWFSPVIRPIASYVNVVVVVRASVAEVILDGCRISVELVEEVSTADLERLLVVDPLPGTDER